MNDIKIDPDLLEMAREEALEDKVKNYDELELKAKAFDILATVGAISYDHFNKLVIVEFGFKRVELSLYPDDYEILEKAINISK